MNAGSPRVVFDCNIVVRRSANMEQNFTAGMSKDEAAKLSIVLDQCLKTLDESNQRSEQTYVEIDRLQAETSLLLDQLRRMIHVEATP